MESLDKKMARGAVWMTCLRISERAIGVVSTIILARLLVPQDFGLIAMAMSVIAVLELMGDFSFDLALIQHQQSEPRHYDTAWTFNVIVSIISALILIIIAVPMARFYGEPRLDAVMYVLALGTLIQGFENIGVVAFRKDLELNREYKFRVLKKLASFLVTVVIAVAFRNYWALVAGIVSGRIVGLIMSYLSHPYRPRFCLSARRDLFRFSSWLFINNILNFLNQRSSDFIIAKMAGAHSLGLYSVAHEISNLPTSELAAPVNRAVFPGYAKMAGDISLLRQGYLKVISLLALIAFPMGVGIVVTADLVVSSFLGEKWIEAVPLIKILAFYGMLAALQNNNGVVYLALGKPRILACLTLASVVPLVSGLVWATQAGGAQGAAWCVTGVMAVIMPVNYFVVARCLSLRFGAISAVMWRPLTATAMMYFTIRGVLGAGHFEGSSHQDYYQLLFAVMTGVVTYVGAILLLWRWSGLPSGAERLLLDGARKRFGMRAVGYR